MAKFLKIEKKDALNTGRIKLNESIDGSEKAIEKSIDADDKATQALANSESTQHQLDTIVIEGDSSVEAAQARVGTDGQTYETLKERLDAENTEITNRLDNSSKIVLSKNEPAEPNDDTFWYEDVGEAPDFNKGSGMSVANAVTSNNEPSDTKNYWFEEV